MNRLTDPRLQRRTKDLLLWCTIILTLLGEVFLIVSDLRRHLELVLHICVVLAVILVPITALAAFSRLAPGKRRVKRRYLVRPFRTLSKESRYDGATLAALFYREISQWGSPRLDSRSERGIETEDITVHFSGIALPLPLSWLRSQWRIFVLDCPDLIIDGALEDDGDESLQMSVWLSGESQTWRVSLQAKSFATDIRRALARVTIPILERTDPRHLARTYWQRGRYEDARKVLRDLVEPSVEKEIDLISVDLESDRDEEALKRMKQIGKREWSLAKTDQDNFARLRALALLNWVIMTGLKRLWSQD